MISNIKICVAVDTKGGFARNNAIPWNIKEDFIHFMNTTKDSWCITGKNSYLEMVEMKKAKMGDKYDPEAPVLKNRETFVISSTLDSEQHLDCTIVHPDGIDDLLEMLNMQPVEFPVFILGGQQLFEDLIDRVDTIIMTHIPEDFNCDRFFPMEKLKSDFKEQSFLIIETEQYGERMKVVTYVNNNIR